MAVSHDYPGALPQLAIRDMTRHDLESVLRIDDILIAYGIMSTGAGEAHVLNLCVAEPYRGKGIGGQVLEHLLEFAASLQVVEVFLEVRTSNVAAIRLYQSMGFTQIGVRRGYYQAAVGREDAIVLRRLLGKRR